ncbi:MAG: TonB-dependent receptor [Treponema sp.]|jgi:vitamin B12 transporter|nr:TonB-dependent receptor [Treponema sp.]
MIKYFPLLFILLPFSLFAQDVSTDDDELLFDDTKGITVVGTVQTSQQMAVVDREEIERRGAADIADLLQETLGLNIVRYGGYGNQAGINLRGFDSKRMAILVDGVQVNSSMDGRFNLEQIDLNSIERIEVIYGGSDSKYNVSGSFGGVINIVTVKKQMPGLRIGGSVFNTSAMPGEYRGRNGETQSPRWEDLLDTQSCTLFAVYGGGDFSFSTNLFFNRAQNHFLFTDYNERTRRKDNNEVWDTGGSVSLVWELQNLTKLIASSNIYYGDSNFPTSGFSGSFGTQQDFSARQSFMVDMPRAFHDKLAAELSLAWHFNYRDYTPPAAAAGSRHDQQSISVINRWKWFAAERLTLRSGIDYKFIYLDSTEVGNRSRHDGGVYLTAEWTVTERLLVIPSAKAVFTTEGSAAVEIIPKLGILWNITDNFAIKNNYFRNFKFPDFEELYWSGGGAMYGGGNPTLRSEDGWGADIGAAWQNDFAKLEGAFFTQWIKDSIHWFAGTGGIWRPENVGEAVIFGLETKAAFEIPVSIGPVKKIIPSVSYQYLVSYLLSYGYTFASNKRIPYNPEHTVSGSLDFVWSTGSFLISGHFESLRYHNTANTVSLKPCFLLNATVNQKIGDNYSVFGALRNILNTSYESFYDYPMPGITITLGLRVNYDVKK